MLLIGSMLCTVGCKKYDDDIKSLNNRVDKIEGSLNDQISPLKTDLETVKAQLEELVSDTESLTATHKSDLATLTKANEDLAKRIKALEDGDYAKKPQPGSQAQHAQTGTDAGNKYGVSKLFHRHSLPEIAGPEKHRRQETSQP